MGNIAQGYVKNGDWSARVNDEYVVGALSIHPKTGLPYEIISNAEIIEAPQWLIDWCLSQKTSGPDKIVATDDDSPIVSGGRNTILTSLAGKMRDLGFDADKISTELKEINSRRCQPPLPESEIESIANSVGRYKDGITRRVEETVVFAAPTAVGTVPVSQPVIPEIDQTTLSPRPVFPLWAIEQTSLYEGFVRPVVESSSKNPEFLWLPSAQIMLNYLSDRVRIDRQDVNLNLFVGLVSDPGKFFKSSSCQLAQLYFNLMGLVDTYTGALRNSDGKVIIAQAGSSEGFGLAMKRINASHSILFSDELSKFVAKIGIENSSLSSDIMTMYERGFFSNLITNDKKHFSFPPGTHTFGLCWCTTTQGFNRHWPRLAGVVSGMEDRMFFCVGPEKPRPLAPSLNADFMPGVTETKRLIDLAISRAIYKFEDSQETQKFFAEWNDPRTYDLFAKFALLMAIELEKPEIDSECLERSAAIVRFRNATTLYLAPIEADNASARLQLEIDRELRKNAGKMTYRALYQDLHANRYGDRFWKETYRASLDADRIVEWKEPGKRGQTRRMVGIPKQEDDE